MSAELGPQRQQQRETCFERWAGAAGPVRAPGATLRQTDKPNRIQAHWPTACRQCGEALAPADVPVRRSGGKSMIYPNRSRK